MNKINISYHKSEAGELIIGSFCGKICIADFRYRRMRNTIDDRIKKALKADFIESEDTIINETKKQIDEYLQGARREFDIPFLTVGSDFQKKVWTALLNVPYGKTASYSDLAESINNPKAVRAVANANGANALAFIIPCHRIIRADGNTGGYGGGLSVKKKLLKMERENK
ncbi:MAG: cysteine methyltransferase [Candidatus Cloacimonadota bacterium]|nr:MAG: cysteine methyltransferase [Candidatus Cloacimonadota bacterium]